MNKAQPLEISNVLCNGCKVAFAVWDVDTEEGWTFLCDECAKKESITKIICDGCLKELEYVGQIHEILYNQFDRFPEYCGVGIEIEEREEK